MKKWKELSEKEKISIVAFGIGATLSGIIFYKAGQKNYSRKFSKGLQVLFDKDPEFHKSMINVLMEVEADKMM